MEHEQSEVVVPASTEKKENTIWELVKFAMVALVIVIPIRAFIAQPFIVSGVSMVPTFQDGDYLIVDEISYKLEDPQRGDVVIFRYPKDTSKFFIKRIVGLPGETVDIRGNQVTIKNTEHPEGFVLDESFIQNHSFSMTNITLKADEYFVMGDNRGASSDSRVWGPLEKKYMTGRALVRLLPLKHMDIFPGKHTY